MKIDKFKLLRVRVKNISLDKERIKHDEGGGLQKIKICDIK